jgi:hypothetical protein
VRARYRYRKSGMEPWFEFWEAVRYAVEQFAIEWRKAQEYKRNMP